MQLVTSRRGRTEVGWALNSYDWCLYKKKIHPETQGRRPCKERGRGWCYAATSQGTLKTVDTYQKRDDARKVPL